MQNFNKKKKRKICTLSNVSCSPCLSIPKLHHVHMDALVHGFADAGTFRQTGISLAGVKLSCVHIYTLKTKTKARLKEH